MNWLPSALSANASWQSQSGYLTSAATGAFGIRFNTVGAAGEFYADDLIVKRVLDPPSTAVKILAAKAGARGWLYADAAFDPNTAATYAVLFVGD